MVIPIAIIVITAVWRAIAARLPGVRNFGSLPSTANSQRGMSAQSAIKLMKGRKRLAQSLSFQLPASSFQFSVFSVFFLVAARYSL